jgi:hypothetical protein
MRMKTGPVRSQILHAVRQGARTCFEVAAYTGFPEKRCSVHLFYLKRSGLVRKVGEVRYGSNLGQATFEFEATSK